MKIILGLLLTLLFLLDPRSEPGAKKEFGQIALATVKTISAADFQGRKTGTSGGEKIETYLAAEFGRIGLTPWNGSYLQKFPFLSYNLLPGCSLELLDGQGQGAFAYNKDFYILPGSADKDVTAEVVFVGYGIRAPGSGYDDYEEIDVDGKIVLVMDGLPPHDPQKYGERAFWPARKAAVARERGAVALLLFKDPNELTYFPPYKVWGVYKDNLLQDFAAAEIDIPVVDKILENTGKFAVDLKRTIDRSGRPSSFKTGKIMRLRCRASIRENTVGANVLGLIPGVDPKLKDEIISIGGHMDGGGMDPDGSIFYGAEDNASGTAVVLEIAERLMRENFKPPRTILFAGWGAEEQGAHGSQYYMDHPIFPLDKNAFNLCVDNVGWGEGEFWLFSAYNFPDELAIVKEGVDRDLLTSFIAKGLGGSDSYYFQSRGIPVLFAHTTQTQSYNHRPLDRAELINPLALRNVTKFMYQAVKTLSSYKGALINPDRYPLFLHRYSVVADAQEGLMDPGSASPEKEIQRAAAKYQILRHNGIDLCGQSISSSGFKETMLKIAAFKNSIAKVDPSIALLEKASQLREIEEGCDFLVALKLVGLRSFDSDTACLEVLHGIGARILCLDVSSRDSDDFRALFNNRAALSPMGKSLLKKTEELGLILELLDPSPEILDLVVAFKSKPILLSSSKDSTALIQKIARSSLRENVYFRIPIDVGAEDFVGKINNWLMSLRDLGTAKFCVLDPFNYSSSGELKTLTVAMFHEKHPEMTIKDVLGENFIRLFSVCLKN